MITEPTWDDVLDDFEDLIDDYLDAMDTGRVPHLDVSRLVPDTPPSRSHSERFEHLSSAADEAAKSLVEAMQSNQQARISTRDLVHAHREYSGTRSSRR